MDPVEKPWDDEAAGRMRKKNNTALIDDIRQNKGKIKNTSAVNGLTISIAHLSLFAMTYSDLQLEITASIDDAHKRVDQFLVLKMPAYSRSLIGKFIKAGAVTTRDGNRIKASQIIAGNEHFVVAVPRPEAASMKAQNIALDIVYSDDHLAVINKPAGLVIHPGAGVSDGTLCNALLYYFPGMTIGNIERPGIVHRLDKDTSGLIVIAKTEAAHRILSADFKERRVEKAYRMFCHGVPRATSFELKTGHARHPHYRLRFTTKISVDRCRGAEVRFAHTSFTVVAKAFGVAELKAVLHTGRTHQIRAHLADIDLPLLGDDLYGGKRALPSRMPDVMRAAIENLRGQALHAETLAFTHPITKEQLSFTAALPETLDCLARNMT